MLANDKTKKKKTTRFSSSALYLYEKFISRWVQLSYLQRTSRRAERQTYALTRSCNSKFLQIGKHSTSLSSSKIQIIWAQIFAHCMLFLPLLRGLLLFLHNLIATFAYIVICKEKLNAQENYIRLWPHFSCMLPVSPS